MRGVHAYLLFIAVLGWHSLFCIALYKYLFVYCDYDADSVAAKNSDLDRYNDHDDCYDDFDDKYDVCYENFDEGFCGGS